MSFLHIELFRNENNIQESSHDQFANKIDNKNVVGSRNNYLRDVAGAQISSRQLTGRNLGSLSHN